MSLASELRDLIQEHHGANLEFARDGYRVSLNPVGDRHSDIGFILWKHEPAGPRPIVAGRALDNRLVVDDPDFDGDPADLEELIRLLIAGAPPEVQSSGSPASRIPTGA